MSNAYYSKKVNVGPGTSGNPDVGASSLDNLGGGDPAIPGVDDQGGAAEIDTGDPAVDTIPPEAAPPELSPPTGGEPSK